MQVGLSESNTSLTMTTPKTSRSANDTLRRWSPMVISMRSCARRWSIDPFSCPVAFLMCLIEVAIFRRILRSNANCVFGLSLAWIKSRCFAVATRTSTNSRPLSARAGLDKAWSSPKGPSRAVAMSSSLASPGLSTISARVSGNNGSRRWIVNAASSSDVDRSPNQNCISSWNWRARARQKGTKTNLLESARNLLAFGFSARNPSSSRSWSSKK